MVDQYSIEQTQDHCTVFKRRLVVWINSETGEKRVEETLESVGSTGLGDFTSVDKEGTITVDSAAFHARCGELHVLGAPAELTAAIVAEAAKRKL